MNKSSGFRHDVQLGRLVANLHTLELVIRDFLLNDAEGLQASTKHAQSLRRLKVGQTTAENSFTNYDNLKSIIIKYNRRAESINKKHCVDESIVGLRDALAHGRVFSYEPSTPMLLLKFSPPINGYVKVEYSAVMTIDWFDKQIKWVHRELNKVIESSRKLAQVNHRTNNY